MIFKYIFFDWHKTLSNDIFWPDDDLISFQVFRANSDLAEKWMRGALSSEQVALFVSNKTGISEKVILEKLEKGCRSMSFSIPKMREYIKKLKEKKISLGIATDNMDTFSRYTVPALNLKEMFDIFLISSDLGFLKNDLVKGRPVFFEKFLKDNSLNYSDILLIDDSQKVANTYKPLGMKIINVTKDGDLETFLKSV